MSFRALVILLITVIVLLGGCGFGPGGGTNEVKVTVSDNYGQKVFGSVTRSNVSSSDTVMRLLQRNFKVKTRYGGGFVQSIDGLSGESDKDPPVDWFYYVNGSLAGKGASATKVHPGDSIWWDRRNWSVTDRVSAVVGSFPEPFRSGFDGKRVPTRVECASEYDKTCQRVVAGLSEAGVAAPLASLGAGTAARDVVLRVLVGPWEEVRKDDAVAPIGEGPKASGVYAIAGPDGLRTLDASGHNVRNVKSGWGLIAATVYRDNVPTWVVTGTDQDGVNAAARLFDLTHLRNKFAIAVVDGEAVPLPDGSKR